MQLMLEYNTSQITKPVSIVNQLADNDLMQLFQPQKNIDYNVAWVQDEEDAVDVGTQDKSDSKTCFNSYMLADNDLMQLHQPQKNVDHTVAWV